MQEKKHLALCSHLCNGIRAPYKCPQNSSLLEISDFVSSMALLQHTVREIIYTTIRYI